MVVGVVARKVAVDVLLESKGDLSGALAQLGELKNIFGSVIKQAQESMGTIKDFTQATIKQTMSVSKDIVGMLNLGKVFGLVQSTTKKLINSFTRFHAELLSVMFFGMMVAKVFESYVTNAMDMVGVTKTWGITLNLYVVRALMTFLPQIYNVLTYMLKLNPVIQQAIGFFMLFTTAIGKIMQVFGSVALGIQGMFLVLKNIFSPLFFVFDILQMIGSYGLIFAGVLFKISMFMISLVASIIIAEVNLLKFAVTNVLAGIAAGGLSAVISILGGTLIFLSGTLILVLGGLIAIMLVMTVFAIAAVSVITIIGMFLAVLTGIGAIGILIAGVIGGVLVGSLMLLWNKFKDTQIGGKKLSEWMKVIWDKIKEYTLKAVDFILEKLTQFITLFTTIDWSKFWEGLTKEGGALNEFGKLLGTIWDKVVVWSQTIDWNLIWSKAFEFTVGLGKTIWKFIIGCYNAIKEYAKTIKWSEVWDNMFNFAKGGVDGTKSFFTGFVDEIFRLMNSQGFFDFWSHMFDFGSYGVNSATKFLSDTLKKLIDWASKPQVFDPVWKFFLSATDSILNLAKTFIIKIADKFKEKMKDENFRKEFFGGLFEITGGIWDLIVTAGTKIAEALIEGLKQTKMWAPVHATKHTSGILTGGLTGNIKGMAENMYDLLRIVFAESGGIFTKPTLAMIGESGPEAVVPLDRYSNNDYSNDSNDRNITFSPNVVINASVSSDYDVDKIADILNKKWSNNLRRLSIR